MTSITRNHIFILMVITLLTTSVAQAGLFDINLGFDIYGSFDDNILLRSDEEIDRSNRGNQDEILQIRPSISVAYEGARSSFTFRYELFKEWYNIDHNELDRTPTSYQDGYFNGTYELTERISLGIYDQYKDALYGTERIEVPDIRDDYITNHVEPALKYVGYDDRWNVEFRGYWGFMNYEEAPIAILTSQYGFADWDEYGAKMNLTMKLQTRTELTLSTKFWDREFKVDSVANIADNSGYYFNAGVIQKLGEGMTLTAFLQLNQRQFKNSFDNGDDTYTGLGGSLLFSNQFSGLSRWEIEAFSLFEGSERVSNAFYRKTGAKTVFYTLLSERVESSVDFSYSVLDYDNSNKDWEDKYFQAGVKLGYKIYEWLSIRGQYVYSQRKSDRGLGEFENNLVSIYLQFRHNLFY